MTVSDKKRPLTFVCIEKNIIKDKLLLSGRYTFERSKNYIEAAQFDDEWYGLTTQTYNTLTGYTSKFVMQLNARTISSDATDYRKFIKSTVAHEFGHVFWLCDNPSTASKSIMQHRRDREKTTAPTTFDINNVNAKY